MTQATTTLTRAASGKAPLSPRESVELRADIDRLSQRVNPGSSNMWPEYSPAEKGYLAGQAAEKQRLANSLGIVVGGPVFSALPAAGRVLGAPESVVEDLAAINADIAGVFGPSGGSGRSASMARSRTGRGGGRRAAAKGSPGNGLYVERPAKLVPGSAEHKADRWTRYQKKGGEKDYDQWSKQYDTNMRNYQYGSAREAEYRAAMEAGEGTVKTPYTNRQIDILKADERYAGQLKTGPVSLTKENVLAIQKDGELVEEGWTVEHILEKGASRPYLDALEKVGVQYKIGPQIP